MISPMAYRGQHTRDQRLRISKREQTPQGDHMRQLSSVPGTLQTESPVAIPYGAPGADWQTRVEVHFP